MRTTYTALEVRKIRAKYRARIQALELKIRQHIVVELNREIHERFLRLPVKTEDDLRAPRTQG